jgi:hypothetical protein
MFFIAPASAPAAAPAQDARYRWTDDVVRSGFMRKAVRAATASRPMAEEPSFASASAYNEFVRKACEEEYIEIPREV